MTSARPRTAPAEIALRRAPMRPRTAPAPSLRLRQKQACGPTVLHEFLQIAQVLVSAPYLTLRYPRDSVGPEGTAYKNSCSPEVAPRGRSATCPFSRRISTVLTRNKYRSHEQQVPFSRQTSTVLARGGSGAREEAALNEVGPQAAGAGEVVGPEPHRPGTPDIGR